MKSLIVYLIFLVNLLFSLDSIPPYSHQDWEILQESSIRISWTNYGQFQWCRASSIIYGSIEDVQLVIENKMNYPNVFKRIEKTTVFSDETVHIILDMPFPFYGRDYIVSYKLLMEENDLVYRFTTVNNSGIPVDQDYIRLVNAAGEWRLHSIDANKTEVTYIWNGELLGDFPNWALPRAWKTQGQEVLTWLKEAIE